MSRQPVSIGKRGLFDIEDFFSFLIYILILFMFLIILSIPRCDLRPEQALNSDVEKLDKLNGEQQLLGMLRTQLPANLPVFVEEKKGIMLAKNFGLYHGVSDYDKALGVMNKNPWLYSGLTYSGFIDRLGFLEEDKEVKKDIFAIVTRALFVADVYPPHAKERDFMGRQFLSYPEIYVKYGVAGNFDIDIEADLENFPLFPLDYVGDAVAVIPLTDRSADKPLATVSLVINRGILSSLSEGEVG